MPISSLYGYFFKYAYVSKRLKFLTKSSLQSEFPKEHDVLEFQIDKISRPILFY